MKTGDVVRTTSIVQHHPNDSMQLRETWQCRKGYRYVFLLLAVEEIKKPVNPEKALEAMGWKKNKGRKRA